MPNFLAKLDRLAAVVLFFVILAYAITGYGLTKGIMPAYWARQLHLAWLGGLGLLAFTIHTSYAFRLAFIRHHIWGRSTKLILILFYSALIVFFLWLNFSSFNFSVWPDAAVNYESTATTTAFTTESLASYDGQNGRPAYIAVDGTVYDVSAEFKNGRHHGHLAGQDLSAAFHQAHPSNYLAGLTVVGVYQK